MRRIFEHEVHQGYNQDRHHQDHCDAAVIGGQLAQDPRRGGGVRLQVPVKPYPAWGMVLRLIMDRNASSSDVHPVSSRSWVGVVWATKLPSRISRRSPQWSASSMTWLETSSVVPRAGELGELLPEIHSQHRIQPDRGLVEHQQLGLADQRARQRHPGALTAGEVAAERCPVIRQPDPLDGGIGGRLSNPYSAAK